MGWGSVGCVDRDIVTRGEGVGEDKVVVGVCLPVDLFPVGAQSLTWSAAAPPPSSHPSPSIAG